MSAFLAAADRLPLTGRDARHAKALAPAWVDWVETERPGQERERYCTDGRLGLDIETSLLSTTA